MTWTAVGSFGDQQAATFSLTPSAVGNLIVLDVANFSNSTVFASSVSSTNVTWVAVGHYLGVTNTGTHTLFLGTVTSTSAATVTPTWSGTAPAGIQFDWHEFHSTLGGWTVDTFTHLDSAGTLNWPQLTPASSGELYWGFAFDATTAVAGSTSGYVYNVGGVTGNGQAYNLNCASGVATGPTWGATDGGEQLGMMVLVQENALQTFPPVSSSPAVPPGWFPGAPSATPLGIPFYVQPPPASLIIPPPPPPPPPAAVQRPVPPGWFPGADGAVAAPGQVPFSVPPEPTAYPAVPYIVGLSSGTGTQKHFVDQYGNPRFWLAAEDWGLPANAGGNSTGTWQQDYETYLSYRAAQGYTVITVDPFGAPIHSGSAVGNTWDGVAPFTSNFNVFNETFWQRIDYLISAAAIRGLTINLDVAYSYQFGNLTGNTGTSTLFQSMTLSQATAYGVTLGNRYKNTPNLLWMFGDDDTAPSVLDPLFENIAAGIRSTGDTHEISIEYYASGTTSLIDLSALGGGAPGAFGPAYATYDWVYYYWVTYWGVEEAYLVDNKLPVVWGDGFFYDDAGNAANDRDIMRSMVWWAIASGARGVTSGSENVFPWDVAHASLNALKTELFAVQEAPVIRQVLEPLPQWYNLKPATGSTLITAGRGTRSAYNAGHFLEANVPDSYVAASITPDHSLALIYCQAAFNITIDTTQLSAGFTATWVDPTNGTMTPATAGSTFNSGALGNNSVGQPDWLLILQGAPIAPPTVVVQPFKPSRRPPSRARVGTALVAAGIVGAAAAPVPAGTPPRAYPVSHPAPHRAVTGPAGRNAAGQGATVNHSFAPPPGPRPPRIVRPLQRALWRGNAGPPNHGQGVTPPGGLPRIPHPQPARLIWRSGTGPVNHGWAPPPLWHPQPRRPGPARAIGKGQPGGSNATITFVAVGPPAWHPQPRAVPPRRAITRSVSGGPNRGFTPPPGVQPQIRHPQPRRVFWRGNPVQPAVQGVAVPAPRMRPSIPRRLLARVFWRGVTSRTVNNTTITPQQGTVSITATLAGTCTIRATLADTATIAPSLADKVTIGASLAATCTIKATLAGTVTIAGEL